MKRIGETMAGVFRAAGDRMPATGWLNTQASAEMGSMDRLGCSGITKTLRRLIAKFEKIIVDVQAASPSSWKTTCMAVRMIS
jgi:hypothetical protein